MRGPLDPKREAIRQAAQAEKDASLQDYFLNPSYMFTIGCGCVFGVALTIVALAMGWFGLR